MKSILLELDSNYSFDCGYTLSSVFLLAFTCQVSLGILFESFVSPMAINFVARASWLFQYGSRFIDGARGRFYKLKSPLPRNTPNGKSYLSLQHLYIARQRI